VSYHDSDDQMRKALSALPRKQASERFTTDVLAALEERSTGHRGPPVTTRWIAAGAVVGFFALAVGMAYQRQQAAEEAYRQQVLELRHEYQRLLEEVGTVREAAAEPPARLYLGGDDQLDLILDLSQPEIVAWPGGNLPATRDPRQKAPDIRPATYEP